MGIEISSFGEMFGPAANTGHDNSGVSRPVLIPMRFVWPYGEEGCFLVAPSPGERNSQKKRLRINEFHYSLTFLAENCVFSNSVCGPPLTGEMSSIDFWCFV